MTLPFSLCVVARAMLPPFAVAAGSLPYYLDAHPRSAQEGDALARVVGWACIHGVHFAVLMALCMTWPGCAL